MVNRSQEVISHIQDLRLCLKETESNIRAYALSKNTVFLIPTLDNQHQKAFSLLRQITPDINRNGVDDISVELLEIKINGRFKFWENIIKDPACFQQPACFMESNKQMNALELDFSSIIYTQKKILQERNRKYINNAEVLIPIILITSLMGIIISVFAYLGLQNEIKSKQEALSKLSLLKAELESKIQELNHTNDELDQFAYVASHDLQEPLRKIISFSEVLLKKHGGKLDNDGRVYLDIISNASIRMRKFIEDLLNYSRLSQVDSSLFEEIDLNTIVKSVLKDLEFIIIEKNAQITVSSLPTIWGIKFQLHQLFLNLLSNSLKYSSPERSLEISIQYQPILGNLITDFKPHTAAVYYQIEIKDNGIGFDDQNEKEIFMIFNRLHGRNEYTGTGIGLAICKRIADNHKGFIKAKGIAKSGAIFTVFLPENLFNPATQMI
ncbi:Phytochrome-like protein cph1 [compost metagenome]